MFTGQFPRVGRCIYCPNLDNLELSDEHIVPLGIRGPWILRDASCSNCQKITTGIETHVLDNMMGPAKAHLGMFRRKQKPKKFITAPVGEPKTSALKKIPLRDHPGALLMFSFGRPPKIMLSLPHSMGWPSGKPIVIPIVPDFHDRAARSGAWLNTKGFTVQHFARMLAKIAHAFTVSQVGIEGFRPLLLNAILGIDPMHLSSYIGSEAVEHEPVPTELHQLFLVREAREDGKEFYVVRLRLFSNFRTPMYRVASGEVL